MKVSGKKFGGRFLRSNKMWLDDAVPEVISMALCNREKKQGERLRMECRLIECEVADVTWLYTSRRAEKHRAMMRKIADDWKSRLEEEAVTKTAC